MTAQRERDIARRMSEPNIEAIDDDWLLRAVIAKAPGVWALALHPDGRRPPVYARVGQGPDGRLAVLGLWIGLDVTFTNDPPPKGARALRFHPGYVAPGRRELTSGDLRAVSLAAILGALGQDRGPSKILQRLHAAAAEATVDHRVAPGRVGLSDADLRVFAERARARAAASPFTWIDDLAVEMGTDPSTVYRRLDRCRQRGIDVPALRRRRRLSSTTPRPAPRRTTRKGSK